MPASENTSGQDSGKKVRKKKHKGRELIECLLVAGALALTIRQFGFQLFKIPTRSMEPTLIGNEDYGDRVVAMMWYKRGGLSLRLGEVRRWQVIVFDHHDENMPKSTNYIKRLVGLPSEELHIRDGDIWIRDPGEAAPHLDPKPRQVQEDLWTRLCDLDFADPRRTPLYWEAAPRDAAAHADGRLVLDAAARDAALHWRPGRPIDNRFIRLTVKPDLKCLAPDCGARFRAAFDTARPAVLCPKCGAPRWGVRDDGREDALLRATAANAPAGDFWTEWESGRGSRVSDLRLAMDFRDLAGAGKLEVTLTGRSERFTLRVPLGQAGETPVEMSGPRKLSAARRVPLLPGVDHHLEVVNLDGEFRAEIDGIEVGACRYQPPYDDGAYDSDAEIALSGGARVALGRLRLWRDIYYGAGGDKMTAYGRADRSSFIRIGAGEYFFMGDNSLASKDGRSFGTKEEKKIVARGLFVAWPPSRFHWLH